MVYKNDQNIYNAAVSRSSSVKMAAVSVAIQTQTGSSIYVTSQEIRTRLAFSWWRHQMETFSALLALCAGNSPPVNSPHKGQWRGTLMFSLICAWTDGWVNSRDAGDLRPHRVHHDVTVMCCVLLWLCTGLFYPRFQGATTSAGARLRQYQCNDPGEHMWMDHINSLRTKI